MQALGGAKNHMVVMPDADLDQAVDALMGAAYGSAGERCMAISVAVAVGDVADALIERLVPRMKSLKIRNGMEADAEMGPLVTAAHQRQGAGYIDDGVAEGAKLVVDGRGLQCRSRMQTASSSAARCSTTSTPEMRIYQEEIFGPVLASCACPTSRARSS